MLATLAVVFGWFSGLTWLERGFSLSVRLNNGRESVRWSPNGKSQPVEFYVIATAIDLPHSTCTPRMMLLI